MTKPRLPKEFVKLCKKVTAKRPRTVIDHAHIAMRPARRLDIMWVGAEVAIYDRLKKKTEELQQDMPAYVKKVIERNL
jgi:hypothetical protein